MSRDVEAGKAFVRLSLTGKEQVKAGFASLKSQMTSFAGVAGKLSAAIGAIGLGAGFAATIKAASDMQETMSKFNVVFGDSADAVKKWGDELASAVGRSKKQIAEFLSSSQDLFVPLGFDPKTAEDLSKQVAQLAIDLGSFNNIADEDVFRDLQAAMTGSGEVMKKYGVVVSEARVKQELLNESIDPKVATEAQKAFARLQLILQGTTAAQGDALRTSDSFANSLKRFHAVVSDAAVEIGEKFLPAATTLVQVLSDAVLVLADMGTDGTANMGELSLSANSLIDALGNVVDAVQFITAAVKDLHAELLPLKGFWTGGFSFKEFAEMREEVSKLKKEAESLRDSDWSGEFKRRMKEIQEAREKAKIENQESLPAAPGIGDAVSKSLRDRKPLSEEGQRQLEALIGHKLDDQLKSDEMIAKEQQRLSQQQLRAAEQTNKLLERVSSRLDDTTTVEVLD